MTSNSKVEIIGQSSRSQEENVPKVVGATSSEDFLLYFLVFVSVCFLWCAVRPNNDVVDFVDDCRCLREEAIIMSQRDRRVSAQKVVGA